MPFTDEQMQGFHERQIQQRQQELQSINKGFTSSRGFSPGPVLRAQLALVQTRFDLSSVAEQHRDHVNYAMSGATNSMSMNQVVIGVGTTLFGNMLRNVGRLKQDNFVRDLANMSGGPYSRPFVHQTDPNRAIGAEASRLKVVTQAGTSPHFDPENTTVSLMEPRLMDQTGHELQHAFDHLHGDLDLHNPRHRLASELNAFTRQNAIAMQTTGTGPSTFEGRSPQQMAESYHGKNSYEGTLTSSLSAVKDWRGKR